MSELSEALGRGTPFVFNGLPLAVEPLDFNDLCELEDYSGVDSDDLNIADFLRPAKNRRFFLWLVLRKSDPSLTAEARERGEYRMTEADAGRLIKFGTTAEQFALVNLSLGVSGLAAGDEEAGDGGPKPEPEAGPAQTPARTRATAPSASSPS